MKKWRGFLVPIFINYLERVKRSEASPTENTSRLCEMKDVNVTEIHEKDRDGFDTRPTVLDGLGGLRP